ncbi:MAG: FAD-dependent oxidoreductase [Candidatus Izemoplasmatales bacterium]|jgi:thioredoxin reductase (NADPH)
MKKHELVIVGCGPAGMMAAIYAKRANKDIVILDKSTPGGRIRSTYQVDNYLGFGRVTAEELVQKMVTHLHDLEIDDTYGRVQKIKKTATGFIVITDDDEYQADAVIIASGTNPKTLNVPNESRFVGNGLSYCAVCDGIFFENKDVVVIGGGDSALEESNYLSRICQSVTLIHDLHDFTANNGLIKRIQNNPKIRILTETQVTGFCGNECIEGLNVTNLKTQEAILIPVQGVFIYVGNKPETAFIRDLSVTDEEGFIRVSPEMQTSIQGLYACGDVTKKDYRLIATAISDGAIAALGAIKYLDNCLKKR